MNYSVYLDIQWTYLSNMGVAAKRRGRGAATRDAESIIFNLPSAKVRGEKAK